LIVSPRSEQTFRLGGHDGAEDVSKSIQSFGFQTTGESPKQLSGNYFCAWMPALWNEKELCGLVFELQLPDPTGDKATPRYFFHLTFGQRVVPDEDGVELPNRWAARDEALAVVRDLAKPEVGGSSRRWASWFLEVADEPATERDRARTAAALRPRAPDGPMGMRKKLPSGRDRERSKTSLVNATPQHRTGIRKKQSSAVIGVNV
jgi:hypothetical protein